jgi:threonine dehydratase
MTPRLPVFEDVRAAAARLKDQAVLTPLLNNPALDERVGGRIFLKAECLQRTGTFKFRGAFNALSKLNESEAKAGVVAFSSGNHAQGVAEAARILGIRAIIVMPQDAPEVKKTGVLARGAEIRLYDRETESRVEIAEALCAQSGAALIPSFDHPDVIAGQGTCGLEIFETLKAQGETADQLVCCVGGGGLIAGINLAAEALSPQTRVFGAEPEGFDDYARSLASGEKVVNARKGGSLCDALLTETPGELTFPINQPRMAGVGVISDLEALQAVRYGFETLKLVLEPGGAAALAAVLSGKIDVKDKTTVIVLTGGNVDSAVFQQALSS